MKEGFEKLGAFYLGRGFDIAADGTTDEPLMYDSKDLTTHAVCVGMTGSGKTGLCVSLLEEAAIDGVPAIVIDPKGDIGNLLLTFPELRPEDFRPWIDERDAARKEMTPDEYAASRAELWRNGLADWGQDGERIRRFRESVDLAIYTPGSSAGLPLRVIKSFDAPPAAVLEDSDAMRERIDTTVSGLLGLLGIDTDPVSSSEHILLSNILDRAWRARRSLDFAALIGEVQRPPFDKVGVMDVDSIFPPKDRLKFAMSINNLLASPVFSAWTEGEPLSVDRLLYTGEGKPRVSILSISHLSDSERMFFVTLLLNDVVSWMRTQRGTGSLRAILYMDEVFGFLPPVAEPPSKRPMLTLMKQARAFGLGTVLATQNPVDIDYKALSNAGTWFLGRLQTERDKERVLDGLEGASATTGAAFNRKTMDTLLAGLKSRVFLMNNVHEDGPALFHTRWAMSYLRGPMSRQDISALMGERRDAAAKEPETTNATPSAPAPVVEAPSGASTSAPVVEPGVETGYLPIVRSAVGEGRIVYRPMLLAQASLHYVRVAAKIDGWRDVSLLASIPDEGASPWDDTAVTAISIDDLDDEPDSRAAFEELSGDATRSKSYTSWARSLKGHLYRGQAQTILHCKKPKLYSALGEGEREFRIRLRDALHEERDEAVEKLRDRYASKAQTLQERIRKAEQRVDVETAQYRREQLLTASTIGEKLLGALIGRKSRKSTMSRASKAMQQRGDIGRAKENVQALRRQLVELEQELQQKADEVEEATSIERVEIEQIPLRPRKGDMSIKGPVLVWAPYLVGEGRSEALFELREG